MGQSKRGTQKVLQGKRRRAPRTHLFVQLAAHPKVKVGQPAISHLEQVACAQVWVLVPKVPPFCLQNDYTCTTDVSTAARAGTRRPCMLPPPPCAHAEPAPAAHVPCSTCFGVHNLAQPCITNVTMACPPLTWMWVGMVEALLKHLLQRAPHAGLRVARSNHGCTS